MFHIINLFLITSCTLRGFKKDGFNFHHKNQLKMLTIPKGVTLPNQNEEYKIPYNNKDLEKKKYSIFPPL